MRNLLTLAALVLFTVSASAQKITTAALKGTWKITAVELFGNHVDFVAQKITFSEEWISENEGVDLVELEVAMMEEMAPYGAMGFVFSESAMTLEIDGEVMDEQGYTIVERGGKQYIESPGEPQDSAEVKMVNGLLYMDLEIDAGMVTMIFKKA